MEAKELRIGNFVYYRDKSQVLEVYNIGSNGFSTLNSLGLEYGSDDVSEYNGIPLTKDWLLKFGFTDNGDEYSKENFTIRPNRRYLVIEGFEYDYNGIIISTEHFYVHDLQNLYFAIKRHELECN